MLAILSQHREPEVYGKCGEREGFGREEGEGAFQGEGLVSSGQAEGEWTAGQDPASCQILTLFRGPGGTRACLVQSTTAPVRVDP